MVLGTAMAIRSSSLRWVTRHQKISPRALTSVDDVRASTRLPDCRPPVQRHHSPQGVMGNSEDASPASATAVRDSKERVRLPREPLSGEKQSKRETRRGQFLSKGQGR